MTDRVSDLKTAEERAREFSRAERNASIDERFDQIERLGRTLASRGEPTADDRTDG